MLFISGTAASFWNLHRRDEQLARDLPLQGTTLQMVALQELRKLYAKEVVNRVTGHGIKAVHDYADRDHAIPLPATLTMELGKRISAERPGAHLRLYSDYSFPWRKDGGPRDEFERAALAALRRQPEQPFYRFEEFEGRPSLRYAIADQMQSSCVACHNRHRDSPKKDWQVGDVRGVLEFIRPLDSEVADSRAARRRDLFFTLAMANVGLAGLGFVYFRLQRTATSLSASELRTRAILDSALDCIITIDHEGKVLEFNPAAERTFGYPRAGVIGKRMSELIVPPGLRQSHERGLGHYLASGEGPVLGKRIEITAVRADGTEFPVELAIEVVRKEWPPVFTGYLRDLSERKQAEQRLAAAREAKIMAEAGSRAKSEFLSRMSHELRTPLNAVLGFGQLLEMSTLTDEQRECTEQINRGGKHLLGLINEVLDIARIEAGRMELSPEPVRVADVFQEVLNLVRPLGANRDIQFYADLAGDGHRVLADNQRLRQVLLNLLSNAVKYNRDRGEVRLSCAPAPPGRLCLTVTDTGCGIPRDKLARLFMPFNRLGAEATGVEGSGLGLALSKGLVELMGGTLTVTSVVGEGSQFCVELPVAKDSGQQFPGRNENAPETAAAGGEARAALGTESGPQIAFHRGDS